MAQNGVLLSVLQDLRDGAVRLEGEMGPAFPGKRYYGSQANPRPAGEALTTKDVCEELIIPRAGEVAYLDTLPKGLRGKANVFVSHAWAYDFKAVVGAIERAGLDEETTYYWFDLVNNNQVHAPSLPFEWWANTFKKNVQEIGKVLLILAPVLDPIPLTRAWCLFEIHACSTTGCELQVEMPPSEAAAFEDTFLYHFDSISTSLGKVDLARAESFNAADRDNIHRTVREGVGFHQCNVQVMERMRAWLLSAARAAVDRAAMAVQGILRKEGRPVPADLDAVADDGVRGRSTGLPSFLCCMASARADPVSPSAPAPDASDGFGGVSPALRQAERDRQTLMTYLGRLLMDQGDPASAEQLFRAVVRGRRRVFGDNAVQVFSAIDNVATSLHRQGRAADAVPLYRQAVDGQERTVGPSSEYTMRSVNSLAIVLSELGQLDEAIELLRRAVATVENLGDTVDPAVLLNYQANLALNLVEVGQQAEGETMLRDVVQRQAVLYGASYAASLMPSFHLANLLKATGRVEESLALFTKINAAQEKELGPEHPKTLNTVARRGMALVAAGKRQAGLDAMRMAVETQTRALGKTHPDTLTSLSDLALTLREGGSSEESKEALGVGKAAADGFAAGLGRGHPSSVTALVNHAMHQCDVGQSGDAAKSLEEAMPIALAELGESSPYVAMLEMGLGTCFGHLAKHSEAATHFRAAWIIRGKALGPASPLTHASAARVADALVKDQRVEEAAAIIRAQLAAERPSDQAPWTTLSLQSASSLAWRELDLGHAGAARRLFEEVLAARTALQGGNGVVDEPATTQAAINAAFAANKLGDSLGAAELHKRALAARLERLGEDHEDTARSAANVGVLLRQGGRAAEAEQYFRRAHAIYARVVGEDEIQTAVAANNLANCLEDLDRLEEAEALYLAAATAIRAREPGHKGVETISANLDRLRAAKANKAATASREA